MPHGIDTQIEENRQDQVDSEKDQQCTDNKVDCAYLRIR